MILKDQTDRSIELGAPAKRIVSIVPSITETLFGLGLESEVIGRTKFCFEPKDQVGAVPIVGGTKNFHLDRIDALAPDLILANKEENNRELVENLMKRHLVWVSDVKTLDDAISMIESIGSMTDTADNASVLTKEISDSFTSIDHWPPKRAAYLIWRQPDMVAGGDTFINDMMLRSGFVNVFSDESRYPAVSHDRLKESDPEVLLLSSEPFPFSQKHIAEYQEMLPNARVVLCDGTYFSWYGSRLRMSPEYFRSLRALIDTF